MAAFAKRRWRGLNSSPGKRVGLARALAAVAAIGMLAATTRAAAAPDAPDASFVIKTWRTTDGLPQSTVTALARTPDGYLWVGTNGGLARFDGVRFVQYGLAEGLRSLSIRALVADEEGGVWVATLGGGLSRVRKDGTITTLTTANGLVHDEVTAIALAGRGGLWVATAKGLQRWTPGGGFVRVGEADGVSGIIMAMAVTAEGLWASEQGRGLFLCRSDGRCERIEEPVERTKKRALFASAFLVDASGDLWVSMGNGVVIRRHAGKWTELSKAEGVPFSVITAFVQGPDGTVWAGTNEAGLHRFCDGRFVPVPGADPTVRALWADADGIVWAGVEGGGLVRLLQARVKAYRVGENDRQGRVNGVAEAPDGQLWVTTFGRGLFRGSPNRLEAVSDFPKSPLRAAVRMSDGTVYVSGYRLLARRDPATGAVRSWAIPEDANTLCEGADGALWTGTNAGDLKRLAGDVFEAVPDGKFAYPVHGLARGSGGALWVATRGAGLFRWEAGRTQRWTTANGLPTDLLQALYADPDGTLWIGTAGGGIAWLDANSGGTVRAVGTRQGLGDGVASQILDDGHGNLWVGGLRGVRRLSKAELRAVADGKASAVHPLVVDEADGMTTAECTAGFAPAGLRARSGIMYFSTFRDVVGIDPTTFDPVVNPPPVLIESVRCDGRSVPLGGDGGLVLPAGSKDLEIRYTGFDGAKPEQLRFRHRLHRDGEWQYVEGARAVRYSALRPGAYEFELSAAKADGRWLEPGVRLAISVQLYFWQTVGFRAAAGVTLLALGAGIFVVVVRRKERLHRAELAHHRALAEAEREIAVQRDELAHLSRVTMLGELSGSMAHELNQPLTAILSNAQAALNFLARGPADLDEVREILKDIVDADKRASEVIRRLRLLFRKGEVTHQLLSPGEVVRETLRLLRSDLTNHGVTVRQAIADDLPPIHGDRVQLQQVLINLVMNACDAMAAVGPGDRRLTVRAERAPDGGGVRLSVTDTGTGIPPERLQQVFEPFVTTKPQGMGLGLAVCRTIAIAHGGRLFADHAEGGGAMFCLDLPATEMATGTAA